MNPTLAVHDPTDGHLIDDAPAQTTEDVQAIASRLRAAQPAWEALGPKARAAYVGKLRDWVLDHQAELTELLRSESGKAMPDAALEAMGIVDVMTYFAGRAEKAMAEESIRPHGPLTMSKQLKLRHRPYQLVGVITPWNFPLTLPVMDAIPALLAGAAVVVKPSEYTPLALKRMVQAWTEDIGAPDVFALALGTGDVGGAVVEAADYIQFTGSTVTGRKIGVRCAERLIPCGLELGGKDPMLVLADANIDRAANAAAWGGLFNAGQVCTSVERVYVEASVYDEFIDKLVERVRGLRHGASTTGELRDIGSMANANQVDVVERHVNDAVASGAKVLTGGRRSDGPGHYYEPTILVDVDQDMLVMREETFGPVV
ncbi:MAG: aldehyde dehydrogenase family protein, partial [Solirubrobacteraceae bacterium]|nr:aldehyde dehydrogenase family protein [Solirubrobacteraceae bacterium]